MKAVPHHHSSLMINSHFEYTTDIVGFINRSKHDEEDNYRQGTIFCYDLIPRAIKSIFNDCFNYL